MEQKEKPGPPIDRFFTQRILDIPGSFIREMLKTSTTQNSISFAGGLPDEALIPVGALMEAFDRAGQKYSSKLFQYANTEGFLPLKEWIASRYKEKFDVDIGMEEIIITNGSQQAFDLVGKVFIEKNDKVIIEEPGYLGVIQSLLCYQPELIPVRLEDDGMDIEYLDKITKVNDIKLMHLVPNFQNPSGVSYSMKKRQKLAEIVEEANILLVEDDPYGELFFDDDYQQVPIRKFVGENGILLGSFSKTLSPGMRLGWIVASKDIIEKLIIAKQASDLHTNNLSQMMTYEYLIHNDYKSHLRNIRGCYRQRKNKMVAAVYQNLKDDLAISEPKGGMFLWAKLSDEISSTKLIQICMDTGVVFVPGNVFYINNKGDHAFRLNFSKSTDEEIENGINIISQAIAYLKSKANVYQNV